jgi:hypothetical protein
MAGGGARRRRRSYSTIVQLESLIMDLLVGDLLRFEFFATNRPDNLFTSHTIKLERLPPSGPQTLDALAAFGFLPAASFYGTLLGAPTADPIRVRLRLLLRDGEPASAPMSTSFTYGAGGGGYPQQACAVLNFYNDAAGTQWIGRQYVGPIRTQTDARPAADKALGPADILPTSASAKELCGVIAPGGASWKWRNVVYRRKSGTTLTIRSYRLGKWWGTQERRRTLYRQLWPAHYDPAFLPPGDTVP